MISSSVSHSETHRQTWLRVFFLISFILLLGAYANIFAIGSPYQPGSTLDPACSPGESNCFVQIIPNQTGNTNKYLTSNGSITSWSPSTLVLGGNFTTSGAYATTITTTGTTTVTLPTSGTLYGTASGSFASSALLSSLSDETGTGTAVFNTSPIFSTNISTPSIISSGALDITPSTGSNLNVTLSTTGDFAVNTNMLYVDTSASSVGIGDSSPASKLSVNGDIRIKAGSGGQIIFADGSTMSSSGLGSAAALSATSDAIVTGDSDADATGDIILKTGSNDRLHILNGGNVGINTATPSALFSVGATSPFQVTNLGAVTALSYAGAGTGLTGTASSLSIGGNAATATILATGRTIAITGDLAYTSPSFDGSGNVTGAGTLATVNSNVGSFGSATQTGTFTVNGKGLITAASNTTITPAVGSITGLGTGVATALGVNVGSAGAFLTFNGDAGTPSALVGTNISGTASGLTAGSVTNATLTTALTVNTGTVTLTGNVANTSALTIGAGAVSVSGTNTGDNATNSQYSGLATSKADVGQTFYIGTTQLAINRASAALTLAGITLTTPDIGTPSAGVVTNLTGTASININGTVGATTPTTGAFTTGAFSDTITQSTSSDLFYSMNSTNVNGGYLRMQRSGATEFFLGSSENVGGGAGFYDLYAISGKGLRFYTGAVLGLTIAAADRAATFAGSVTGGAASFTTGTFSGEVVSSNANSLTFFQLANSSTGGKIWSLISAGASNVHSVPAGTFYLRNSSDNTTALAVTSGGNVGIGTAEPKAKLDVSVGNQSTVGLMASSGLIVGSTGGVLNNIYQIGFGYSGGDATYQPAAIYGLTTSTTGYNNANIVFATRSATTDTAPSPRMTIQNDGNVGIGLTTPLNKLSVWESGTNAYVAESSGVLIGGQVTDGQYLGLVVVNSQIARSGVLTETSAIGIGFNDDANGALAAVKLIAGKDNDWTPAAADNDGNFSIQVLQNNAYVERMRIDSAGNHDFISGTLTTSTSFITTSDSGGLVLGSTGKGKVGSDANGAIALNYDTASTGNFGWYAGGTTALFSVSDAGIATFAGPETTLNYNPQTNLLAGYKYLNFGGGSIMYRDTTDVYYGSNAKYGSAGTVVANYTSAVGMGLLTMDGGTLNWQGNNTSVTAGTAYGVPLLFTITNAGSVGIGIADPYGLLSSKVAIVGSGLAHNLLNIQDTVDQNNAAFIQFVKASGSAIGGITRSGTTDAVVYNTTSDRRLKQNIVPTTRGLADLMQIQVSEFDYIADPNHQTMQGFIAQDLYATYPDAVTVGGDDPLIKPWQVDYGRLTPLIVKSIQELDIKVQSLPEFEDQTLASKVAEFLRGIAEGIANIGRVRTRELCVEDDNGEVCITKDDLQQIINNGGVSSSGGTSSTPDSPDPDPVVDDTTPPAEDPAPTVDPEPTPEPTPDPEPDLPAPNEGTPPSDDEPPTGEGTPPSDVVVPPTEDTPPEEGV